MAVPTISLVTPATGKTIGRELIEIYGTNFRLPIIPTTIPAPVQPPTVEVLFGSTLAQRVDVITDGRLIVITPPQAETVVSGDVSAIDITVRNIDDNGDPIAGESVTATAAYTYKLPELWKTTRLQYLVNEIIQSLKDQVHPEVMLNSPHTDWDDTPLDGMSITAIAKFPAIVLNGPEMVENRFYSQNALCEADIEPSTVEEFVRRREPRTVDVGFQVLVLSDSVQEVLNLTSFLTSYFHNNKTLGIPTDITNPATSEVVDFELDFQPGGDFAWSTEESNSNIRQFRGSILIRGFDVVEGPEVNKGSPLGAKGSPEDPVINDAEQAPQQGPQGTTVVSPGPC